MSTFKALNVESDEEPDDEVDVTKELQIEEALKLYQNALKLHSQGPKSYSEASKAYKALLASEIFRYPDAPAEFNRAELDAQYPNYEYDDDIYIEPQAAPAVALGSSDPAPSTLPQILHLSYKNHAEFMIDLMQQHIREQQAVSDTQHTALVGPDPVILTSAVAALGWLARALDKDDSDAGLWRRTARITELLNNKRVTRFCLEGVLDSDDDGLRIGFENQGLEEAFASEQLVQLLKGLPDDISLLDNSARLKTRNLSSALKKRIDPYPLLPRRLTGPRVNQQLNPLGQTPVRHAVNVPVGDWSSLGHVLWQHLHAERSGMTETGPGSGIAISISPLEIMRYDQSRGAVNPEGGDISMRDRPTEDAEEHSVAPQLDQDPEQNPDVEDVPPNIAPSNTSPDLTVSGPDGNVVGNPLGVAVPSDSVTLPTRKRSTDAAGLPETAEGGRIRSKRIKARESLLDATNKPLQSTSESAADASKRYEDQHQMYIQADHWLFNVTGELLQKLGVNSLGSSQRLRDLVHPSHVLVSDNSKQADLDTAIEDLYEHLQDWTDTKSGVFLRGEGIDDPAARPHDSGLAAFLEHAKTGAPRAPSKQLLSDGTGVCEFARSINNCWTSIEEAALLWIDCLLQPGQFPQQGIFGDADQSSYIKHQWPAMLKNIVVQLIVELDEHLYNRSRKTLFAIDGVAFEKAGELSVNDSSLDQVGMIELIQTLFELHLDVYSLITNPGSKVDTGTRIAQKDRLERWFELARDALDFYDKSTPALAPDDQLVLRHMWASVFYVSVGNHTSREHIALCIQDLVRAFASAGHPVIDLPNNAITPELSVEAADRELSRLTTMDFFLSIFDENRRDPVAVIESLEPLLDRHSQRHSDSEDHVLEQQRPSQEANGSGDRSKGAWFAGSTLSNPSSLPEQLSKFLECANASLRLTLWRRLREAYHAISYMPKVVSCYFRSIEVIMRELQSAGYLEAKQDQRQFMLLKWLRSLDDTLARIVRIMQHQDNPFECMDDKHVQSSMTALAELARLLHAFTLHEDCVRLGQAPLAPAVSGPHLKSLDASYFKQLSDKFHDMQLRTWTLLYLLFKDGVAQNKELFPVASEDKVDFLRSVHYAFSCRGYCHACRKLFLRLMRDELRQCTEVDGFESDMAQVLYDIYGLKCSINASDCHQHGSIPEVLDRQHALSLLDIVLDQARKVNIKDLQKTDLRLTIEKLHVALGKSKPEPAVVRNKRTIIEYIKSPINPLDLYRCLKGTGNLSTVPVQNERATIAAKGWYYLMGHIAMARFRALKRTAPSPTEDLKVAIAFFIQDLEYDTERWESWYRMAQAYDSQIEEHVLWSGEKLNGNRDEIKEFQRSAIHCYVMAVATAARRSDLSYETTVKVSEMYTDFGIRLYSSSREPFAMEAFERVECERPYSGYAGMYNHQPFRALQVYKAWQIASVLFKRALQERPDSWINHYMLGKCLWKMYTAPHTPGDFRADISMEEVVDAFVRAIDTLPKPKDSRQDPVLEPHYKLVSVVHKLVQRNDLSPGDACSLLQATPYARKLPPVEDVGDWEQYMLNVLKALRTADKANWHHRMIARAAHVIYDDSASDLRAALGAKHELTQQIFTKTMAIQVWKPEHERPGRHFVYTSRYLRFFVGLLVQLGDRASLETLARRVRRKPNEFLDHAKLWQELCAVYIMLLRRHGQVPEGQEDAVFKSVTHEDFHKSSDAVEKWCQDPNNESPIVETLRDSIELKKLNNGLMKGTLIDDLIGDAYAVIWAQVAPTLSTPSQSDAAPPGPDAEPRSSPAPVAAPWPKPMFLANLMNLDGAVDLLRQTPPAAAPPPPEHTTKSRIKFVTRTEIRRSADTAINKAVAAPGHASTTSRSAATLPERAGSSSNIQVLINRGRKNSLVDRDQSEQKDDDDSAASLRGSLHDSADESSSVLSDVDEEIFDSDLDGNEEQQVAQIRRPLFPNLSAGGGGGLAAVSVVGDVAVEEEDGGNGAEIAG